MKFAILGSLELHGDLGPLALRAPKQRLLLALLIARSGRPTGSDMLIEALWNGEPPASARKALGWHLFNLRQTLGGTDRIEAGTDGYVLHTEPGEVDAERFLRLQRLGAAAGDPMVASPVLAEALSLWRGPAYDGLADTGQLRDEADRLDELRLTALEQRYQADLDLGRHHDLVAELTATVNAHPLREAFRAQLMLALHRCGRQADALQVYRRGRSTLAELGLNTGMSLRRLEQRILQSDPTLDLCTAVAGPSDPRPVLTPTPAQLPADTVAFTGREAAVTELLATAQAITEGTGHATVAVRTIDGMAGVGKTTLAVHAARRMAAWFPDGQLFLNLHGFSGDVAPLEPGEALERLLRGVGIRGDQLPIGTDDRAALWRSTVGDRRILLVLDNAGSEEQVRPLLPGGGRQLALVTSRRRLSGLDDARHMSLGLLSPSQAATLFIHAAEIRQLTDTQREQVAQIVGLCGLVPLAIRLAAAQLRRRRQWTISDLLHQLSDEQQRLARLRIGQREISSAFGVSLRDLDADHRRLFRRLGVFPGPHFDAYAAAALTAAPVRVAESQLEFLSDVHLIEPQGHGRFGFHDLLRQYAATQAEQWVGPDRQEAVVRLIEMYTSSAITAARLHDPAASFAPSAVMVDVPPIVDQSAAITWYDAQQANLLAATGLAAGAGLHDQLHRLMAALGRVAASPAHIESQVDLANFGFKAAQCLKDPESELRILNGLLRTRMYSTADKHDCFRLSLAIYHPDDDTHGRAVVLNNLGLVHWHGERFAAAVATFEDSIALARQTPRGESLQILVHNNIAALHLKFRRTDAAEVHLDAAWSIVVHSGTSVDRARTRFHLGELARLRGRFTEAVSHHVHVEEYGRRNESRYSLAVALNALGNDHRGLGDLVQARVYHQQAWDLAAQLDDRYLECRISNDYGMSAPPYEARSLFTRAADIAKSIGEQFELARAHRALAALPSITGTTRSHDEQAEVLHADLNSPGARNPQDHHSAPQERRT